MQNADRASHAERKTVIQNLMAQLKEIVANPSNPDEDLKIYQIALNFERSAYNETSNKVGATRF
ncbi:hypothetical protein HDU78_002474 [Chytriomyces hyalinus]|nr:hypothetical protein HDU78_002474 [Chytriomyces hyalinus]